VGTLPRASAAKSQRNGKRKGGDVTDISAFNDEGMLGEGKMMVSCKSTTKNFLRNVNEGGGLGSGSLLSCWGGSSEGGTKKSDVTQKRLVRKLRLSGIWYEGKLKKEVGLEALDGTARCCQPRF